MYGLGFRGFGGRGAGFVRLGVQRFGGRGAGFVGWGFEVWCSVFGALESGVWGSTVGDRLSFLGVGFDPCGASSGDAFCICLPLQTLKQTPNPNPKPFKALNPEPSYAVGPAGAYEPQKGDGSIYSIQPPWFRAYIGFRVLGSRVSG